MRAGAEDLRCFIIESAAAAAPTLETATRGEGQLRTICLRPWKLAATTCGGSEPIGGVLAARLQNRFQFISTQNVCVDPLWAL